MSPPTRGNTRKTQSCASASPPPKIADAIDRAGFTDVLSTGIVTRWMSVRVRPIARPASGVAARGVRDAEDDEHEERREQHLDDDRAEDAEAARRELAEPVAREPALLGRGEPSVAGRADEHDDARRRDAADDLRDDVAGDAAPREPAGGGQAEGDGRR